MSVKCWNRHLWIRQKYQFFSTCFIQFFTETANTSSIWCLTDCNQRINIRLMTHFSPTELLLFSCSVTITTLLITSCTELSRSSTSVCVHSCVSHLGCQSELTPLVCITDSDSSCLERKSVPVYFPPLHEPIPNECLRHGPEGRGRDYPGLRQW